jgi:hypothetical protein
MSSSLWVVRAPTAPSISLCRNNKEIMNAVRKLQEFQVPQFMLDKMKTFMRSVQGNSVLVFSRPLNSGQM